MTAYRDDFGAAAVNAGRQMRAKILVGDHDRMLQAVPMKQACLGLAIGLQRAVVIEMVAGQVGEHRDVEFDAVDPPLRQPMAGHFHRQGRCAIVAHVAQDGLQVRAVGRGVGQRGEGVDAVAKRADAGAAAAVAAQALRQPVAAGGLAVGPGDAHRPQTATGMACHFGSDPAKTPSEVWHCLVRHIEIGRGQARRVPQYGAGTGGDGVSDEPAAVGVMAGDRREDVAWSHLSAVDAQAPSGQPHGMHEAPIEVGAAGGLMSGVAQVHRGGSGTSPAAATFAATVGGRGVEGALSTQTGSGRSCGIPLRRRASAITRANTGADTTPP